MEKHNDKYIFGVVKVGERGQIAIPKEAREVYHIQPGEGLLVIGDKNGMALVKPEVFQKAIEQAMEGMPK